MNQNSPCSFSRRRTFPTTLKVPATAQSLENSGVSTTSRTQETITPRFSVKKLNLANAFISASVGFLIFGFGSYLDLMGGRMQSLSPLALTYGFPGILIGFALKYAELSPVHHIIYADADEIREVQATSIQLEIIENVTRYRYGDEQHLDLALERIFRFGRAGGLSRRDSPKLVGIREQVWDGKFYTLILEFKSPAVTAEAWSEREPFLESFFRPGIEVISAQTGESEFDVALIANGKDTEQGGRLDSEVDPLKLDLL